MNQGDSVSAAKTIHSNWFGKLVKEDLGLLDDASEYYDNALKNRMKILGSNDIDVAFSLQRYDSLKIY